MPIGVFFDPTAKGTNGSEFDVNVTCLPPNMRTTTTGFIKVCGIPKEVNVDPVCEASQSMSVELLKQMEAANKNPDWQKKHLQEPVYTFKDFAQNIEPTELFSFDHQIVITFKNETKLALIAQPAPQAEINRIMQTAIDPAKAIEHASNRGSAFFIETPNSQALCVDNILVMPETLEQLETQDNGPEISLKRLVVHHLDSANHTYHDRYFYQLSAKTPIIWTVIPVHSQAQEQDVEVDTQPLEVPDAR